MSNYIRFKIGPYVVIAYDWDLGYEYHVRHLHNPGMTIPFPTERAALDWIFWMVTGRQRARAKTVEHDIGAWFVRKYRGQVDQSTYAHLNTGPAFRNMKKQGLPLKFINYILDGV